MNRAAMLPEPRAPAIATHDVELAVAADQQRIAIELADTVIRDLFVIGLTLQGTLPMVSGAAEQRVAGAVDGIDRIVRTIRDVVFAMAPHSPPDTPSDESRFADTS
jgi:signal transduction histidine kinase